MGHLPWPLALHKGYASAGLVWDVWGMVDARTSAGGRGAQRPSHDRSTLLASALLGAVALLAWTALLPAATGRPIPLPPIQLAPST